MRVVTLVVCAAVLSVVAPAAAATISFTGTLGTDGTVYGCPCADAGEVAQFAASVHNVVLPTLSTVSAITFSHGGGTNGAGATVAAGGFEPYLSLFDSTGVFLASTLLGIVDPGGIGSFDVALAAMVLGPGTYYIAISAYMNMSYAENDGGVSLLSDGFTGLGNLPAGNDLHYAFDVVIEPATTTVPAPSAGILLTLGLGTAWVRARRAGRRTTTDC